MLYQPGFIFRAVRSLVWENFNIMGVSTLTELIFILNDRESIKGYEVLQRLLKGEG